MKKHDAPALPGWLARALPFDRVVVEANGRTIHAIDHGPRGAPVIALFHGNPTWCFLWRKVIAALAADPRARGFRIVAPDLLGLGLSEKPLRPEDHTVTLHVETQLAALRALDAAPSLIVGQDWGGPIGAGVARGFALEGAAPRALMFMNTAVLPPKQPIRATSFHRFANRPVISDLAFRALLFPVPVLSRTQGDPRSIGPYELAAYAWPLRRLRDRAAPLGLARMVPHREGHPSIAPLTDIGEWVRAFDGQLGLLWGTKDPILGRALARHQAELPRARVETCGAGHFLQEEVPDRIAQMALDLV
jgi:haloalkane dehalogenase